MLRKIFKSGNSLVISLPKESLSLLKLSEGSTINVSVNLQDNQIVLEPAPVETGAINAEFAQQLDEFIEQYRPALEALAK